MPITISGSTGVSGVDGTASSPAVRGADTNTGVFYPAADQVAIATGGVQRLLVDASGIVTTGVGALYPLVSGTAVASTSGTSIDFTSIPSWAKRITIMLSSVSTSGTSSLRFQLGDSGGIENTGYASNALTSSTSAAINTANSTAGFDGGSIASSSNVLNGALVLTNVTSNTWVCQGSISNTGDSRFMSISGGKSLSDTLTQVRVTTANGTDTFDAGSINILYE
jgi:hypothetical protein